MLESRPRQTSLDFQIGIYPSISSVPANSWHQLVPENRLFLHPGYLAALEDGCPENLILRYAVVSQEQKPLVAAVFQRVEFPLTRLYPEPTSAKSQRKHGQMPISLLLAINDYLSRVRISLLVCGNLFAGSSAGFSLDGDVHSEVAYDALIQAVRAIQESWTPSFRRPKAILVKDFSGDSIAKAKHLLSYGYTVFSTEPLMCIANRWPTFDEYEAGMRSKYRNRLRRVRKRGVQLTRESLDVHKITLLAERLQTTYRTVLEGNWMRLGELDIAKHFVSLKRHLGDCFQVRGYFLGETLVGFCSWLYWNCTLYFYYPGIDAAINIDYALYPNMLYDLVEHGIELGARAIIFGRTAAEIKSSVGAVPVPTACFISHEARFLGFAMPLLTYLARPSKWIQRHAFRIIPHADPPPNEWIGR